MIDKEKIEIKLAEIRKQKEQMVANLNALSGAEQALQQLISEYDIEEDDDIHES